MRALWVIFDTNSNWILHYVHEHALCSITIRGMLTFLVWFCVDMYMTYNTVFFRWVYFYTRNATLILLERCTML